MARDRRRAPVVFPRDGYQGGYISEIAESLRSEHGDGLLDEPGDGLFRSAAEEQIFANIRETLSAMRIEFDVYSNEIESLRRRQRSRRPCWRIYALAEPRL